MKKIFFLGTLLLSGLMASCKDENATEVNNLEPESTEDVVYSVRLVDEDGNQVTSLDGDFHQLYAEVEAEGDWCLSTNNSNFIYLTTEVGHGNGRVPVFVSSCWAGSRDFSIEATPLADYDADASYAPATRASGTTTVTTESITQSQTVDLSTVADRLSSNLGAGYTVSIANSSNVLLKTQMQLFNLGALAGLEETTGYTLLKDDVTPQMTQKYIEANSKAALQNQVTVGVNGTIGSNALSGSNVDANVTVNDNSDSSACYAARRQLTTFFTREVNYRNILSIDSASGYKALAPGFRMMRNQYQNEIFALLQKKTASDSSRCYRLVDEFIREVGPNFISKASMGCALDYYIKVDSSSMKKGFTVKAVLDIKYDSQVKDTASTATKDSTKFSVGGDADVIKEATKAAQNSEVEVVINGGDVSTVDVLCNGGQLTTADIKKWQGSIKPENSVMIEMEIVPISAMFTNTDVSLFIYEYLVAQGLTERYADKVFTTTKSK